MNILIGQPRLETDIKQLETDIRENPHADVVIYPEGYLNQNVEEACLLAKTYNMIIITGHKKPKDRAIIINRSGEVILDRAKYDLSPVVQVDGTNFGHILCDELVLQGLDKIDGTDIDFIAHPIGVGMFSEEQFDQWIQEAKKIAITSNSMIIGTSHADGTFGDYDVSIPIAYCLDKNGEEIIILKNDTRTILFNTETGVVEYVSKVNS